MNKIKVIMFGLRSEKLVMELSSDISAPIYVYKLQYVNQHSE